MYVLDFEINACTKPINTCFATIVAYFGSVGEKRLAYKYCSLLPRATVAEKRFNLNSAIGT